MDLTRNLRYALRTLRKTPGFTALTIAILTLGIGANTAIFSLVQAVLLQQLPYDRPGDLVWIWSIRPDHRGPFNVPDFIDYRDRNRTFGIDRGDGRNERKPDRGGRARALTGFAGLSESVSPDGHGRSSRPNARTRGRSPGRARGGCSYPCDVVEPVWGRSADHRTEAGPEWFAVRGGWGFAGGFHFSESGGGLCDSAGGGQRSCTCATGVDQLSPRGRAAAPGGRHQAGRRGSDIDRAPIARRVSGGECNEARGTVGANRAGSPRRGPAILDHRGCGGFAAFTHCLGKRGEFSFGACLQPPEGSCDSRGIGSHADATWSPSR